MDDNPFLRLLGVELTDWQPDLAELQCELRPELLNRSGALQGGVLATLIDAAWGAESMLKPEMLPDDLSRYEFVHIAALSSAQKMLLFVHECRERGARRISAGTYYRLVQNEPATVRAICPLEMLRIPVEPFRKLLSANHLAALKIVNHLAHQLAERLVALNDRLLSQGKKGLSVARSELRRTML